MRQELNRRVAEIVRETYISEVRAFQMQRTGQPSKYKPGARWDGGFDAEGAKHTPIWPKIAKRVLAMNLDPEAFVKRQFQSAAKVPWPNMLLSPRALENYKRFADFDKIELADAFEAQTSAATTEVAVQLAVGAESELDAWVTTLLSERVLLTALYRYCIARRLRYQHPQEPRVQGIINLYREAAIMQYLRSPDEYDAIWTDLLPAAFRRRARERQNKGMEINDGR